MTRDELTELLLAYLYDRAEGEAHSFFFFPLEEFAVAAGITDPAELLQAAHDLEAGGFVMLSQDLLGQVSAFINLEGTCYVEAGGETGIIAKYRENPEAFIKPQDGLPSWLTQGEMTFETAEFTPPPIEEGLPAHGLGATDQSSVSEGIRHGIVDIINAILEDPSLDDVTRSDLLRDAETLNIQLAKTVKNQTVIETLLRELSLIPSLAYYVTQLSSYV